ncbi:MAG: hypothetical protein Q9157_005328, partial [Trypethelium eluteriae]
FIHDPLLTWRLGNRESLPEPSFPSERRASIIGVDSDRPAGALINERPSGSYARPRARSNAVVLPPGQNVTTNPAAGDLPQEKEVQNARALQVLKRVRDKLTGRDFKPEEELKIEDQVEKLLQEATSLENLCQHYIGWCSFW